MNAEEMVADLVSALDLERIEENLFRGRNTGEGFRRLFGGQVMATPPARARSQWPARRLSIARIVATSEVEHAVCTLTAGPSRPSRCAARLVGAGVLPWK